MGTGDGDVLMRFLPRLVLYPLLGLLYHNGERYARRLASFFSFRAVLNMAQGMEPEAAAEESLKKITQFYPDFSGAVVAVDRRGNHGVF